MLPALLTDTVSADVRRAVDLALLWGLEAVALRTVGRERVPYTNEARLRRVLEDAEMPVAWVDPGLYEGAASNRAGVLSDAEALREVAPFCRRLGCSVVAVGALAEVPREEAEAVGPLRRLGDVAQGLGLQVAVRNGGEAPSGVALASLVREVAHPAVGALWDVAASRDAGDDASSCARLLVDAALFGVEVDEEAVRAGLEESALMALAAAGFEGPVILAFSEPPEDGLAASTALVRGSRLARRATRG